ncbi:hypothetical protein AGR1A_Cc60062 [Agrobacterium fabacearum CFBP 5771]|nr:hypothetical protein AGR1A_Cc60062 [Agrobacterium fabacearum CFBP 5771]
MVLFLYQWLTALYLAPVSAGEIGLRSSLGFARSNLT